MKREFLSFTCRGNSAQVEVLFEFFNPDPEARTLMVGFQSPSPYSPMFVDDELASSTPPISDLRIMNDGRLLPYRIMMAEDADAPLMELGKLKFSMENTGIFVYLFEMTFRPGMNTVQHSYRFDAGYSTMNDLFYSYILTTGAKWAGGVISDFTLEVDMGPNSRFEVADVFGSSANWSIAGIGKVETSSPGFDNTPGSRIVRVLDGKLVVAAREMSPKFDIEFRGHPSLLYLGFYEDGEVYDEDVRVAWLFRLIDGPYGGSTLAKDHLRLLRNMLYAQHGYVFKDPEVQKTFEGFDWYIPDPNLEWHDSILSPEDQRFQEEIKLKEAE